MTFTEAALRVFPDLTDTITRPQVLQVMEQEKVKWPHLPAVSRGIYKLSPLVTKQHIPEETDEEISARIKDTYESLETLISSVAANVVNSLIVSGSPGIGKSHTVETVLRNTSDSEYNFVIHKGYCRASHLFRLLWENRHPGMTIVLDDTDAIFGDETALNILKAALELKPVRRIGWGSEKIFEDQDGEEIPRYFDYQGSIIFLTNKDIRGEITANSKNSPHLSALESRSLVLDMKIRTKREYMVKIKQTVKAGMLKDRGISQAAEKEIMEFVELHRDNFQELSLRMVEKIAALYTANQANWKKLVRSVCFK